MSPKGKKNKPNLAFGSKIKQDKLPKISQKPTEEDDFETYQDPPSERKEMVQVSQSLKQIQSSYTPAKIIQQGRIESSQSQAYLDTYEEVQPASSKRQELIDRIMQKKRLMPQNEGSGINTPAKGAIANKLNPGNLPRVNNTIKSNKGIKTYDLASNEPM